MTIQRAEMPLGRYTLSLETGRMAKQSDGAVVVRLGDTVVLATANAMKDAKAGVDFLPLTVDYRENTYAAGKIPGGFFKREGRPNEKEILTSRMIDRPLRPLFPEGYANETQVIGLLLSADLENDSDTLAIIGASTALYLSEIPFESPDRRRARGLLGRPGRGQPQLHRPAHQEQAEPPGGGHRRRHRDGRVRRPGDLRGGDGAGPDRGPRGHQADRRPPEGPAGPGRQAEVGGVRKEMDAGFVSVVEQEMAAPLLAGHADARQDRVLRRA